MVDCVKRTIAVRQMAKFFAKVDRAPLTRSPKEVGLAFEDISFEAADGVRLKAWFLPAGRSKKLVVFNHFMLGNRAGAVPHPDWGNVSVDFLPIYKTLVEAGYSVFTYELRNHGESDVHDGGKLGLTHTEYQDAIAAQDYVAKHYPDHDVYLYSQCYGTVATMRAMERAPEKFADVKAFVNIQPLSADAFVEGVTKEFGLAHPDNVANFARHIEKQNGYGLEDLKVTNIAPAVTVPTMLVQVRKDFRTTNDDLNAIFAALGTDDKEMVWIDDQVERLEGYNHFSRHPDQLVAFLDRF